jgi:eukaryotic-like serine/threonine-protein kinase
MSKSDSILGHTLAGRYRIDALVAEEALGRVYAATQLPEDTRVSVKILNPTKAGDVEALGRFEREMLATASIEHPNTVKMLDFGEHRGLFHFIVFEHLDARPLEDFVAGGPMRWERAVHVGKQVAGALAAAHALGIVHRNLSPRNVMLLGDDVAKVRDFGFARLESGDAGLTMQGVRLGSPTYMAPEYLEDGVVDPRGDVYALGIVLAEMISGHPPDHDDDKKVPSPSRLPKWLDELYARMVAEKVDDRPTAAEVEATLEAHTKAIPAAVRRKPTRPSVAPQAIFGVVVFFVVMFGAVLGVLLLAFLKGWL